VTTKPASPSEQAITHYDGFASRYDPERFENSYGRYVNAQERRLLKQWLPPLSQGPILDLGCGTGRLLDFGTHGLDGSGNMAAIARQKHPGKVIQVSRLECLDEIGVCFSAIYCMHVFMHLSPELVGQIVDACWERLQPRGVLVFDVPSLPRRRLTKFHPESWHANNAMELHQITDLLGDRWRLTHRRGILLLPVHRIPRALRRLLRPLDDLASATPLNRWASYWIFRLVKKS
jgi:SAM-dependent methyltransferase